MTRKFAEKNHQPEIYHSKREKDYALYTGMIPEMGFRLINPLHSLLFALALNAAMSGTAEKSRVENSGRGKYGTKHQSDDPRQQQSPSAALSLAQPTAANDWGTDIAESLLDMGNTFDRLLSKTLNYPFQAILSAVGAQDTTQPAILQPGEIVSMDGHRLAHWNTISSKWSFIDERYQLKTNPSESDWAVSTEQHGKQTLINGIECITIQVNQTHVTVPVFTNFQGDTLIGSQGHAESPPIPVIYNQPLQKWLPKGTTPLRLSPGIANEELIKDAVVTAPTRRRYIPNHHGLIKISNIVYLVGEYGWYRLTRTSRRAPWQVAVNQANGPPINITLRYHPEVQGWRANTAAQHRQFNDKKERLLIIKALTIMLKIPSSRDWGLFSIVDAATFLTNCLKKWMPLYCSLNRLLTTPLLLWE